MERRSSKRPDHRHKDAKGNNSDRESKRTKHNEERKKKPTDETTQQARTDKRTLLVTQISLIHSLYTHVHGHPNMKSLNGLSLRLSAQATTLSSRGGVSVGGDSSQSGRAVGHQSITSPLSVGHRQPELPSRNVEVEERMERGSKKGNEQRPSGSGGGSSTDDLRSELRRMADSGLHGILKSFGRVDELLGGQSTGKRLKEIVENLNSSDMSKIRVATDDLNNLLNNTAEDAYSTFPIDQIIPALVRCMNFDEDFDVTLKAIRCLGTFARSLPSSCNAMVNHDAVPALCKRLLSIEVIDVAEESIRAIKYIAKESPQACLVNGALFAVLSYLDFFSHHEQRDAVESAAFMCRGLKPENCAIVIDQVPTLVSLLGYEDVILVEKATQALLSICEAAVTNADMLQILSATQLVGKALDLISGASISPIKISTFYGLAKILTLCAANHASIAELLLENSISEILFNLFSSCASGWCPGSSPGMIKTPEQLTEILKLTDSLLPAMSQTTEGTDAMDVTAESGSLAEVYANSPELIAKFGTDLLPILLQVHNVTASQPVRARILAIWSKVVKLLPKEVFQTIVRKVKISSLLGPLLLSSQDEVVVQAMSLVEALMEKLPDVFSIVFVEEGVVHAIAHLASPDMECELTGVRRSPRLMEMRQARQTEAMQADQTLSAERQAAMMHAHQFLSMHFPGFSPHQDTNGILKVKSIVRKLTNSETTESALVELLDVTSEENDGLSTFEFLRSQVVQSLNQFLLIEYPDVSDHNQIESALKNVKMLIKTGLSFATPSGSSPLQGLIHKLKDAVAGCESFPVRHVIQRSVRTLGPSAKAGSEEAKRQNVRLASLGQPLKLKLERHPMEKELKELTQSQVLVEPLVVMQALEEYLWPRVRPSSNKTGTEASQAESNDPSGSSRPDSGKSRSMIRRSKPSESKSSTRQDGSPDSESMSCSHDESDEGGGPFPEEDLFLDDEDPLDDDMSDDEDFDEEDEIEGLSHVHSLGHSEDVDDMEDGGPSSSSDRRSYAQRLIKDKDAQIEFCIGDVVIKPTATTFQAIRESIAMKLGYEEELEGDANKMASFRQKWEETHTISYRKRVLKPERSISDANKSKSTPLVSDKWNVALTMLNNVDLPEELDVDDELKQLLLLLKMLDIINAVSYRFRYSSDTIRQLSRSEFVSSKLATKLSQQIHDPLTVCSSSIPPWIGQLVTSCKFLFPFELRRKFFYCKLGVARALLYFNKEYEAAGERKETLKVERGDSEVRLSLLKSSRVRVSRSKIFSSAMQIMDVYAHNPNEVLEVHYYNESGVGEGPTLEFYTLMSQELMKRSLNMWRDDNQPTESDAENKGKGVDKGIVCAPKGLFPRPYAPGAAPDTVLRSFTFMGKAIARSLIDGRLMDLNIHPLFFRILRGESVDIVDIQSIDPHLGSTLEKLQTAADACKGDQVLVDGASLEDLCLPYTLPGYPDYTLATESHPEFVDAAHLHGYVDDVAAATLSDGIQAQISAFRDGFESVLSIQRLDMFYEDELDLLLRGSQGCWTVEELSECVHFSHGYSPMCDQARWFLEILSELDEIQRRSFLQFLTGSPRLPPGGIAALSPKLTVVQRLNNREGSSENDLPSVATCVNFLKLPKYGSKEVMKDRLTIAFNEGQYAFDLS